MLIKRALIVFSFRLSVIAIKVKVPVTKSNQDY